MTKTMRYLLCGALAACLAAVTLHAQQRPADRQRAQPGTAKPPEIFCDTMQTGGLCPTGTVGVLKLSGAKVDQWLEAVRRYNKAVEEATTQLRGEARGILTPEQLTQLERWFGQGLNPQINRILASQSQRTP